MPRNFIQMSESANNSIQEISVVDVYDLASDIGKECEKIIDAYGTDTVKVRNRIFILFLTYLGKKVCDCVGVRKLIYGIYGSTQHIKEIYLNIRLDRRLQN